MTNTKRQYDLDWLRVLVTGAVFLFHTARAFNYEDWHIKNADQSIAPTVFVGFLSQLMMPIMFLVSAYAVGFSLTRRANGQYISDRFNRLIIPLLVGIFTHVPFQVYIERVSHGQFSGSFFEFIPHYFDGMYGFGGNFAWMGLHLWYLLMLFLFTLLTLPLFRRISATGFRLPDLFQKSGAIMLLAIPIIVMEMLVNLQPDLLGRRDFGGWSPLTYLVMFVTGYLLGMDDRARDILQRNRRLALTLGLAATTAIFFWLTNDGSSRAPLYALLRGLNTWTWIITILGYANRHLNFDHPRLNVLNEMVLPFYILHQSVIVIVAFFITRLDASIAVKYLAVGSTSLIIILALLAPITRINALRFLFGMKSK